MSKMNFLFKQKNLFLYFKGAYGAQVTIVHQHKRHFVPSRYGRNDWPNHNTLLSPPSKQSALIVFLL